MAATKNGWGLIGTGRIANERILPAIRSFAGNRLVGVVSRDAARAKAFAEKFGAEHAYTRYEDLLANPDVTVIAIHTPNSLHAQQTITAAAAGKHVFCDKPMATCVADAQRMIAACDQAGVKLAVNFHNRFMPSFVETRRIIENGEIGELKLVVIEASPGARPGGRLGSWRVDPQLAGLGTTMSIGVHVYDILRYLLGAEIESVTSFFDTPRNVMEEVNLSTFRFSNGVMAHVNVNENVPYPLNDFVIHGTKGRIFGRGLTRSRSSGELEVRTTDGQSRRIEYPVTNAHEACVHGFSRVLLESGEPAASGIDGLRSIQLTEAMARSAWDGVHVRIAY
ncbi:MAG TPA: Gfo/Idh/MocA family oxidoreductase [Burkholderiales bacterium]|nr:Gfo/Idh/MocA family oxidoreductase [Burkholderiales bacterium]